MVCSFVRLLLGLLFVCVVVLTHDGTAGHDLTLACLSILCLSECLIDFDFC